MTDHDKIRERIRQLLGRTVARGCSEAEAMEAAAKAASLMAEHGLAAVDVEFTEGTARMRIKGRSPRDPLWASVAFCTTTAATMVSDDRGVRAVYLGREPGPEIAVYLHEVLDRAIDKEIAGFKASTFYKRRRSITTRRDAVRDFTTGLVGRLQKRLQDLFAETIETGAEARKQAKVERDRRNPDAATIQPVDRKLRYEDAAWAGYGAGSKVPLSRGVGGPKGASLQIGRS